MTFARVSAKHTTISGLDKAVHRYSAFSRQGLRERLFTNLFQNAVEACQEKENCVIHVSELRENGSLIVSIKDNGEGIPSSMQSKIFAPNFTTKSSGTGLGLAMCKSIVEQAHGKIWFETKLGEGTTFHIELPLAN